MKKILGAKYFIIMLIGLIITSCAPSKTTSTATGGVDNKESAEQCYSIGYEYLKHGKYDDAITNFQEAIKLWTEYYAAYVALAQAYRGKRDIVAAEETYNKAKQVDPTDPRAYEGIATIYFLDYRNYDKAIAEYERGLQVDPTNVDLLNGIAASYMKKKEYDKVLEYYNRSLEYEPEKIETMFAIANVYIKMGEPNKAISFLQELKVKKPKNTDVREKLAETLVDLKRYNEAAAEYQYLLEIEPDNYLYHLKLGLVYQRQKKYTSAEKEFEDAKRLVPGKALPLFYLADLNIVRGRLGAAENYIKEAQKLESSNSYAHVLFGDIYERRGWNAKSNWDSNKSKKKCSILKSAINYFNTAISYYQKARVDKQYSTYVNNEITRCNNWIKTLEENKWFHCK